MRRVVADTNVLVSAIEFGGKPKQLLDLAIDGHIVLAISEPIHDETLRVLRDQFHRAREELREADKQLDSELARRRRNAVGAMSAGVSQASRLQSVAVARRGTCRFGSVEECRARRRLGGVVTATSQESDMNIIYKGVCEQCKAEIIIILRQIRTLENLRGQFKRPCLMCEQSEVTLEMQGFRGDTA